MDFWIEEKLRIQQCDPQWLDLVSGNGHADDFKILLLAVIKQAVMDYMLGGDCFESAEEFLFSDDFEIFCNFLRLRSKLIHERLDGYENVNRTSFGQQLA